MTTIKKPETYVRGNQICADNIHSVLTQIYDEADRRGTPIPHAHMLTIEIAENGAPTRVSFFEPRNTTGWANPILELALKKKH